MINMKKSIIIIAVMAMIGLTHLSCNPDVAIPRQEMESQYTMIYMPQAEGDIKTYVFDIKEEADELILGAAYGGVGSVAQDIHVSIVIDPTLIDDYNNKNGTSYTPLPEEAYTITGSSVVIPRGSFSSTTIKALVKSQTLRPFKEYMLVARIESTDAQIPINDKLKEAFFILKTSPGVDDYPLFDRALWKVESFSTEEPKEGTWGNGGQVIHTFDGNDATFWHSKWDGGEAPPPHWFIIDMGETKAIHGLSFLGRQSNNSGKPKEVVVELSVDGTNWFTGGSFELQNINNLQSQFLVDGFNADARYFKVTVKSSYNAVYTHLAEINAF